MSLSFSHREPLLRVDLYHAPQEVLAIGRDKVRDVELAALDLLQQLPKVVVVEGERAHQQGVQDHPAGPDVRPTTVVLLALGEIDLKMSKHAQRFRLQINKTSSSP